MAVTLIAGASGLLGPYLLTEAARHGNALGLSRSGPDIEADLLDYPRMREVVAETNPDILVYAAALTNVDACETEPERADALHRDAVANLVDVLRPDAALIYISTDQVYPDSAGPHREPDIAPVNVYGSSKLAGEQAALAHPGAVVVRTNLFGPSKTPGRNSLSDFMTGRLQSGERLPLFRDVLFSPLHMETLCRTMFAMVEHGLTGVYNVGCRDGQSKMDFGLAIAAHLGIEADNIDVVDSTDLPGRVKRARDLRMNISKLEQDLGHPFPTLLEEVKKL